MVFLVSFWPGKHKKAIINITGKVIMPRFKKNDFKIIILCDTSSGDSSFGNPLALERIILLMNTAIYLLLDLSNNRFFKKELKF